MGNISSVVAFMRRALLKFSRQLKLYRTALTVKTKDFTSVLRVLEDCIHFL